MIISELINLGSKILKQNNNPSHLLDSELILSKVLNKKRESLLIMDEKKVTSKSIKNFKKLIKRRFKNEPLAYIFNGKEFWSKNFFIGPGALIPRPETELLVEKIIKHFQGKNPFILDAGTGSGCILLSLLSEMKQSRGIGVDISRKAIDLALKNAKKFNLAGRAKFYKRAVNEIYGYKFDLIVSNPPYICTNQIKNLSEDIRKYEPKAALDGGNDGLDVIKKVIYKSKTILKKKGILALEIGHGQYKEVSQILKLQGFKDRLLIKDYQDNIRCILTMLN